MYLVSFNQSKLFLKLQFLYLVLVGASSVWFLSPLDRIFVVCFLTIFCDQSFRLIFYILCLRPVFEEVGMAGIALCWIWTAWEKPGDMAHIQHHL